MSTKEIVVRQGDTLITLAVTHLGQSSKWPLLYEMNSQAIRKEHSKRGLSPDRPEDLIFPGTILMVPDIQK